MKKKYHYMAFSLIAMMVSLASFSQNITLSGNVKNNQTQEVVPAVSVILKGSSSGTFTDEKGNFKLVTTKAPPFTLVISSIGFGCSAGPRVHTQ